MNPVTQIATASQLQAGGINRPQANEWRKFYEYPISILNIAAAGGVGTANLQIQNDAPFFILQFTGSVRKHADGTYVTNPDVFIQITDGGSNYPLFFAPVDFTCVIGNAQLPYVLPIAYMIMANSTLQFAVTNSNGADAYDVQIVLGGFKKFVSTAG